MFTLFPMVSGDQGGPPEDRRAPVSGTASHSAIQPTLLTLQSAGELEDFNGPRALVSPTRELPSAAWQEQVFAAIALSEYDISFQEPLQAYQSPNRSQDLRITYRVDGFGMTPRLDGTGWSVEMAVVSVGKKGDRFPIKEEPEIALDGARMTVDHGDFTIEYANTEAGMRQNFRIEREPQGSGILEVAMELRTDLLPVDKGGNSILFCKPNTETGALDGQVWYKDLAVWDATGKALEATMRLDDERIVLAVLDDDAVYPILIDPLSTTASWIGESNQIDARFGLDVHTAGDVNGDGYSDVIVGAPGFDNGQSNEGAAYVYHGSASGLGATAAWFREGNQIDAGFGHAVATAGDVNDNGYSDVVVGAHLYDNGETNEGVAFVYMGSATGLGSSVATLDGDIANSEFGWAVACAGDVNFDGFSDIAIGAPETTELLTRQGKVHVFHGAPIVGFNSAVDWVRSGAQAFNLMGFAVSSAGDVNANGYSDLIIGEPGYTNGELLEGRAIVIMGTTIGLAGGISWSAESDQASASMGNSVSWAGDVNGDGYSDVIVGANVYDNGEANEGRATIYPGSALGLLPVAIWTAESDQAQASYGIEVSGAGDVNGDGYADVIVGASRHDSPLDGGKAYVYFGGALGPNTTLDWTQNGSSAFEIYGYSVSAAGDVNGDGYSDVIVGAYWAENGQSDEGRAYVYNGSPSGLGNASSSRTLNQTNARFGLAVASTGDLNGDGYCDVIVGAPYFDNGNTNEGRAYVYLGTAGGISLTSSWNSESNQTNAEYGRTVGSAGDVNGDGYCDVLIAAPYFDNGQLNEGRSMLYSGSITGLGATPAWTMESDQVDAQLGLSLGTAGDVNGDGYSDVIIGIPLWDNGQTDEGRAVVHFGSSTGLSATFNWSAESDQAGAQFGLSVATAGDVYTDGYSDVVIGAPFYDGGQTDEGRVCVYYGTPSGPAPFITWSAESDHAGAQFGISVSTAGDVNGDGKPDLIIGANLYDGPEINEGRAFVYHGSGSGLPATPNWTAENNSANSQFGYNVSNAGDVNGDGYGDVLISAHLLGNGRTHNYLGSATGLNTVPAWTSIGSQVGEQHGTSSSGAGDVDGDGYGDVIVGSPLYNSFFFPTTYNDAGRAQVYYGNLGGTLNRTTRQYRSNMTTPVQPGNGTFDNACTFTIGQVARSWMGRRLAKLSWQVLGHAPPFTGTPLANSVGFTGQSAGWTAITTGAGVEIKQLITFSTSSFPRWRVRVKHHPATMIDGQVYGRWYYFGIHDEQDHSVKTDFPDCGLLPVELTSFTGRCEKGTALLEWTTASEQNSDHFTVERSDDLRTWTLIDRLPAAGHSQASITYSTTDATPLATQAYYRLAQVDADGTVRSHGEIPVEGCVHSNGMLNAYPNPTNGLLTIALRGATTDGVGTIEVHDATGQLVLRSSISIADRQGRGTIDLSPMGSGVYFISAPGVAGSDRVAIFKD